MDDVKEKECPICYVEKENLKKEITLRDAIIDGLRRHIETLENILARVFNKSKLKEE